MTPRERLTIASLQLRALAARGWGVVECAARLGWNKESVRRVRDMSGSRLDIERAEAVQQLYARLGPQRYEGPGAPHTIGTARRRGWLESEDLLDALIAHLS